MYPLQEIDAILAYKLVAVIAFNIINDMSITVMSVFMSPHYRGRYWSN